MTNSVLEQIKELEEQKTALADEAKKEAVAQAQAAVDVLGALGYQYTLVREDKQKKTSTRRGTRKPRLDRDCTICKYQTNPPHDARLHRGQTEKAPFSDDELGEKGLTIVRTETVPEVQESE